MQMQILLPLGCHAHLAEPGCLCTKQALGACASKLLENRLGTRRRTSYLLTASGVGTRSPTWTTAVEWKGAVIYTPAFARYPFTAGWTGGGGGRQGKKNGQCSSASGGTRTHDPWPMPKTQTTSPPGPHKLYIAMLQTLIARGYDLFRPLNLSSIVVQYILS